MDLFDAAKEGGADVVLCLFRGGTLSRDSFPKSTGQIVISK